MEGEVEGVDEEVDGECAGMRLTWWGGKLLSDSKVFLSGHCYYQEDQLRSLSSRYVAEHQGEMSSQLKEERERGTY